MKKFPELVEHAETLTGGDPKIVATIQAQMTVNEKINNSIPVYEPEPVVVVVVTNKAKSTPQSGRKPAAKKSTAKTSSAIYRDSPSTSTQRRSNSLTSKFSCHLCNYSTDRMFLIMNHNKTHSNVEKRKGKISCYILMFIECYLIHRLFSLDIISPIRIIPQTKLVLNDDDDEENVKVTNAIGTSKKTQESAKKGKKTKVQPISSKKSPRNKKLLVNEEVSSPTKQNSTELKKELLADWDDEEEDVEKKTNESKENNESAGKVDSTVNLESSSKTVSPAKSESSPTKAIRNIPKKQRIDEFIMKPETKVEPEIEKKLIPEAPAVDVKKSPVKVVSPTPKVSPVKNESPSKKIDDTCFDFQEDEPIDVKIPKAGKRKHVEEPEEPISKIKNNETKNDESLLLATEFLLNETEVPLIAIDAAKSSSPTTFQKANDIDKRNLPPKERNKRIFKAKTQQDTPIASVEKLEKKTNQNGGQNEVTPVKKTVAAVVSKTVDTPVESPVAKEQRTPIVLPIKKSHSRNLNDFPRAMTSREMRSNDSNKSIQLEEPKTQKRKSLVQRNVPQPPPPPPTPAVEQQNTKKSGSESGFEDSDFSDYNKELDKKTRQTSKKPNVEVTPQNQASTSRDINNSNSTTSKTRTPRKRLSEIDLFAAEEIFIVKRQRQRERERLGHEPEVSPKAETEKGSQKSVQKVAAKAKLEKTPTKSSSKVSTKVEVLTTVEVETVKVETVKAPVNEEEKKNTHRRTYKRVASGLCITSKGQLVETSNTVVSTTANITGNVTVMSDVILSQAKMTSNFDNYATCSDEVPVKISKIASSPIKNTKATDSPAKAMKIADTPSKVTKSADTPKQNTSTTLSSLSPRPKSSSSPQTKSNLNRTVLKIPSHKLEEFKRQGLVSTNNPNGRSVMTSKGLFEMATKMEKLIQKSDEDDAAIEDDSQNNKMDLGTKKENESPQKVEEVTAVLTAIINEEPALEIKSSEMSKEIQEEEVMTPPIENIAITQVSPKPTSVEEECTEQHQQLQQQQQAEPVNGKLSEPEESETITEVMSVQTKEQEDAVVEKEEEKEILKEEEDNVVPQKMQPELQEINGTEEPDDFVRDEQMPEVPQVENEEGEIDDNQLTMLDENSQETESINAEMESYSVSLPEQSPVEESNSENNNVSSDEPGYVALNADNFGGPSNCFFLCIRDTHGKYSPVNNELLVLDEGNALVPYQGEIPTNEDIVEAQVIPEPQQIIIPHISPDASYEITTNDGEKIVLNCQTILSILQAADNSGTAHVMIEDCSLELNVNDILESIRIQSETNLRNALLLNADVSLLIDDAAAGSSIATPLDFPITTAHVSETWARPTIMSTVVSPEITNVTKAIGCETATTKSLNIDDSLATIGLGLKHNIPKSLELPLTITNPAIAGNLIKHNF